jgi:hypothetical protein
MGRLIEAVLVTLPTIAASLIIVGCDGGITYPSVPIDELLDASEQVTIGGHTYSLRCESARDFFPPTPPEGRPLVAYVTVIEADSLDIPKSIDITKLWLVYDQSVWEPFILEASSHEPPPYHIVKIARNGPFWPCNIYVDAVVRLEGPRGESRLLRAPDQQVMCTH